MGQRQAGSGSPGAAAEAGMPPRQRRGAFAGVAAALWLLVLPGPSALGAAPLPGLAVPVRAAAGVAAARAPGPFFMAPFRVRRNRFTFGQSPVWTPAGHVLSNHLDARGFEQVYRSRLSGRDMRCLTCGRLAGPNGFPQARPQGDWVLFCSMGAQPQHFGNPCLGGYGSDLYVMRPDGSGVTRLTAASDPGAGARYDNRPQGVAYDNYHPYWSPDGHHLVWTRTEAYPLARGGQRWEILLGDFAVPPRGRPRLTHIRVVGPAFGVYETQAWAPDGSGFLFTAFGPRRSPYQADPPGWMHLELYFMRLYGRGASPAHPRVTHLTDDDPAYEEQAVFTPDMREVIVMTNRARPATWYEAVISTAQWLGFDAPLPGSAGTAMFLADFSDRRFTSDLYMIDVATGAARRLTDFGHVIPEFSWDRAYTRLLWTEYLRDGTQITRVGRFTGITAAERRQPDGQAPGLFGAPIDMARLRARDVVSAPGTASRRPLAPALAGAAAHLTAGRGDQPSLPPVTVSYLSLLLRQLRQLEAVAGPRLIVPPF